MRMRLFFGVVSICAVALRGVSASDQGPAGTDTTLAEKLGRMGCYVELSLKDGRVTVDRVRASGRITDDRMSTEPLPQELFACLEKLSDLRSLRLDVKAGERDRVVLRALTRLQSLRELELFGQDVNADVMTYVCSLTNLESLSLWNVSIGEQGLARLPDLKALKRLELSSFMKVNRHGIEAIAKLHDLEYLRIYGQFEEGSLSALTALPKLETVLISGPHINTMLAELKGVSTIQRIEIAGADVDAVTVEHLCAIKNLQFLKLQCCGITTEALKGLQSLRLHQLDCVGIGTEALSELAKGMAGGYGDLRIWY